MHLAALSSFFGRGFSSLTQNTSRRHRLQRNRWHSIWHQRCRDALVLYRLFPTYKTCWPYSASVSLRAFVRTMPQSLLCDPEVSPAPHTAAQVGLREGGVYVRFDCRRPQGLMNRRQAASPCALRTARIKYRVLRSRPQAAARTDSERSCRPKRVRRPASGEK